MGSERAGTVVMRWRVVALTGTLALVLGGPVHVQAQDVPPSGRGWIWGGGISAWDSPVTVINNTISGNSVDQVGAPGGDAAPNRGGGIDLAVACDGPRPASAISGNKILENYAESRGGGLSVTACASAACSCWLSGSNRWIA